MNYTEKHNTIFIPFMDEQQEDDMRDNHPSRCFRSAGGWGMAYQLAPNNPCHVAGAPLTHDEYAAL